MAHLLNRLRWPAVAVLALAACDNAGSALGRAPEKTGVVLTTVYLDRDGSRTPNGADTTFAGARVALLLKGSDDTLKTVLSGANGVARFTAVPFGEYRLAVSTPSLGDTVQVAAIDSASVKLTIATDTVTALIRIGYPEVSIRQARALPAGKRVFVRAVILAGVQSFRDGSSNVADSSGAIRLTRVVLRGGLTGNNPGDSVSVLGVTASETGQPTLDQVVVSRFGSRPPPIPSIISTGVAANASNGTLDAALVQIIGATISDSATVTPDYKVIVSDGSGSLSLLLDANQSFVRSAFRPGRQVNARGVLVPDGVGGWFLKPRDPNDAVVF